MPGISAVLIAKNEERVIERCLKSLVGLDEIVILDTGSTDKTKDLATRMGARVVERTPTIVPFHFGLARNEANLLASHEWIFSIDADEVVRAGSIGKMRKAVQEAGEENAFVSTFLNHAEGDYSRTVAIEKVKLFKVSDWEWRYRVHEQLIPRKPDKKNVKALTEVVVEHLPEKDKSRRHGQNIDLLKMTVDESPEFTRAFRYLGQELMLRKEYQEAIPYLAQYAEKTEEGPLHKSEALMHIGRCYAETARVDEALKWYDLSSAVDPRRREPLYQAALNLIKNCRLEEALVWIKRMMSIPVTARPNTHLDLPDVWGGTPIKMLTFCNTEIARAKEALESRNV
jgi:tetratricopeptide (TPR) repeat protein